MSDIRGLNEQANRDQNCTNQAHCSTFIDVPSPASTTTRTLLHHRLPPLNSDNHLLLDTNHTFCYLDHAIVDREGCHSIGKPAHIVLQCQERCPQNAIGKLMIVRIHYTKLSVAGSRFLKHAARDYSIAMQDNARQNLVVRCAEDGRDSVPGELVCHSKNYVCLAASGAPNYRLGASSGLESFR